MPFVSSTFAPAKVKPGDIIKAILLFTDETVALPKAEILFDADSILYVDDEAEL